MRHDALTIWQAGVDAVKPPQLFASRVHVDGSVLYAGDTELDFRSVRRLVVVGAGKASAGLAIEFERHVVSKLRRAVPALSVQGWINCPEGTFDSNQPLEFIKLFAARPIGRNEPTEAAIQGTERILQLVADCDHRDVVVCLLSGGGSALLTAPSAGVTLADKQAVAHWVAGAGGNIEQLNTVRRALSDIKGGGLARACHAGRLLTLIVSDVLGDPLEAIASGPTVPSATPNPRAALEIIEQLGLISEPRLANVVRVLRKHPNSPPASPLSTEIEHVILGNNADAVDAAGIKAVQLGYRYVMECATKPEGDVRSVAEHAIDASLQLLTDGGVDCWISGGEPTVRLPPAGRIGKGGRNQQLALAVMHGMAQRGWPANPATDKELAFVSGGTDGEDGPTDAAGAWFDRSLYERVLHGELDMAKHLADANAYPLFEQTAGLIRTNPTGTNVCDLRVAIAGRK